MDVIHYFSTSYHEARGKFLEACRGAMAFSDISVESFDHPGRRPDGGALATDVAVIGDPAAERVLLLNSGTHGNEGFCGSGCMVGWLRSGRYRDLPAGLRVVLVHAINPHGFAWVRRVTEDNVDLNRNFVDHDAPYPPNRAYGDIHPNLIPAQWTGPAREAADAALAAYAGEHGAFALQTATSQGQYSHPDGMFFGGNAPTWSNRTFRAIVRRFVKPAQTVGFVDYHTGLGPYGTAELISDAAPDTAAFARLQDWYGNGLTSPEGGSSNSPALSGVIFNGLAGELPETDVLAIAAEYGTYPLKRVFDALRGDHWLANHGELESDLGRAIKAEVGAALYPDEDDWKELVYLRSRQLIDRAAAALADGR